MISPSFQEKDTFKFENSHNNFTEATQNESCISNRDKNKSF